MKTYLIMSSMIVLLISGCFSSTHKQPNQMPIVYVDDLEVDGIVLHQANCTAEYVQSLLGLPTRIDHDGKMLRYTDHGLDLWFSGNMALSEIHLNQGFKGELDTGISMSSSKQRVFRVYGEPVDELDAPSLNRKNDERILYKKDNISRIYYGNHGLLFWFKDNAISQIVPFKGRMSQGSATQTDDKTVIVEKSSQPKPIKSTPPKNECKMSWEVIGSVEQANAVSRQALKDLSLGVNTRKTRTVTTRDPKTGRTISKQVPVDSYSKSDGLSAVLETKSASGITFRIEMLLQLSSPETTQIIIMAVSSNQHKNILCQQCEIIQKKINEAIQSPELEAIAKPVPYPKTMILEHEVSEVYEILYEWSKKMEFDCQSPRGDVFYKALSVSTGSGIDFRLVVRGIDSNKTKLEMDVGSYEGKEEFPMILKSLEDALAGLEENKISNEEIISVPVIADEEMTVSAIQKVSLADNDVIQVKPNAQAGFNFPFYLFIPKTTDRDQEVYLLVETNNTGKTSDELEVHQEKALNLVSKNYPNRIARSLGSPLLVPVFPRPSTNWQAYTHALDRDTLEIKEGELERIDLQLTAMIKYAQRLLRVNGFKINDQIFMHGFSASAKFCNRYSYLHPDMVKAEASGGVNGLPTLPVSEWNSFKLPFPIGIAGIERFINKPFDEKAFRKVAHYIYMGFFDRNDTLPSRDAWSEEEADIIKKALAEKMMPDRWELTQKIYKDQNINAQCVTYNGVSHTIKDQMLDDVVKFFKANSGEKYNPIKPHQYPFVEYKQIKQAHVSGLHWLDDEKVPTWIKENPKQRTFLIGIEEWHEGQDHRQLEEFRTNAGFKFSLKAEGQKKIKIGENNYSGTCSQGNGEFQAFFVKLDDSQFEQIVPGMSYRLEALNDSNEYFWVVNDGVRLSKADRELE